MNAESDHLMAGSGLEPGQAPPSFAQTGEEFTLHDSDIEDLDPQTESFEMRDRGVSGLGRRPSASTIASFQLYTADEENTVRRKFDRKLVLFVALLFMLSFIHRSSTFPLPLQRLNQLTIADIGNTRIAGMDQDLQTTPPRDNWYEWSLTAFYIAYIAFEWMSILWKIIPAHIFNSMVVMTRGIAASLQSIATSYPVLIAMRVLLGIGEAGFTGIPFFLSFFYKKHELAFRTAIFISAAPLATSFASTLAWIITKFAGLSPIAPWRLLFLIEGFPSVIVAVIAWNYIPDSPQTAFYLTKREKKVSRLRLSSEKSPSAGLKRRDVLPVLLDPVAWITAAMFFLTNLAYSSLPVFFLPKIMTEMGYSTLTSQALSAPPYLIAFIVVLFTAHLSDRIRARTIPIILHALASAFGYATLALAKTLNLPNSIRYMAVYPAAIGFFNVVTLIITWSINNQANESRQGGGFAMLQLIGQCGPLVGMRLYPEKDAPYYSPGMQACAWAMLTVAILAIILRLYLQYQNVKMERAENSSSSDGSIVEEEGLVGHGKRKTPAETFRYML